MAILFWWKICVKDTLTNCHCSLSINGSTAVRCCWSMTLWPHWKNNFRLNGSCWIVSNYRIYIRVINWVRKAKKEFYFKIIKYIENKIVKKWVYLWCFICLNKENMVFKMYKGRPTDTVSWDANWITLKV